MRAPIQGCDLKLWLCAIFAIALCLPAHVVLAQSDTGSTAASPSAGEVKGERRNDSLIGMQYEEWFFGPQSWKTTEAVPLLGRYRTDEPTVSKHYDAFERLGVDWLLVDWSNMLWMKPEWEQHTGEAELLDQTTSVLFQTALRRRKQGQYAPKLVLLLGLRNGPPVSNGVQRLNGELRWLERKYLDRPEYKDLWLYEEGRPLITILYWPRDPCAQLPKDLAATRLDSERWTIRWMASQLQDNHAERCGIRSWMDGVIPQIVTRREGKAEDVVVTPSSFQLPGAGWTAASAIARDHGVPYLQSWKAAFEARPRFIQIHQWNEFAGQEEGHGLAENYWGEDGFKPAKSSPVYADEYSVQLSDDLEPTDLHACGLRDCGGWGYYYFNLTRTIVSLYRHVTPDITVLALSGPAALHRGKDDTITLHWDYLGVAPSSYTLAVDGVVARRSLRGSSLSLDTSKWRPCEHRIRLTAKGVHTYFSLDPERETLRSPKPLPVVSEILVNVTAEAQR